MQTCLLCIARVIPESTKPYQYVVWLSIAQWQSRKNRTAIASLSLSV